MTNRHFAGTTGGLSFRGRRAPGGIADSLWRTCYGEEEIIRLLLRSDFTPLTERGEEDGMSHLCLEERALWVNKDSFKGGRIYDFCSQWQLKSPGTSVFRP